MKKIVIPICIASFLSLGACNNNKGADNNSDSATTGSSTTNADSTTARMDTNTNKNTTANSTSSGDTSMSKDRDFLTEAASGGLMEVELGKIASTNAASPKVKEFGRMMVTDHSKANTELKTVAGKENVAVPATPADKQQKHIDDLKAKKGADFDKDYVDMMVDDHKEDIDKFQDEAKNGKNTAIKAFAAKTLPVLYKHLNSIKTIKDGMKK